MYINREGNDIFLRLSCEIYLRKAILDRVSVLLTFSTPVHPPRNDRYNLILNLYSTYDVTINSAVCFCHDLMATKKLS